MADLPNLLLHHRPDLDLLTARWLGESDLPQLQAEYEAVLAEARAQGTARILLDIRRRDAPDAAGTHWFSTDWLPRAVAALAPTPLRLAYLISPQRAEQLRRHPVAGATLARTAAPAPTHALALFPDEGEAVRWLLA